MKTVKLTVAGCRSKPTVSVDDAKEVPLPYFTDLHRSSLRWLIEDYPRLAEGIADTAAVDTEKRLKEFGRALHRALVASAPEIDAMTENTAVLVRDPRGLTRHWPWELLCDHDRFLTTGSAGVFRVVATDMEQPSDRSARPGPLRILSVVARPKGVQDVGFRMVARRMLAYASDSQVEVTFLRPPTLKALSEELWNARDCGTPFDVVHFDGHGTLIETPSRSVGAILFENARRTGAQPANGRAVAQALQAGQVDTLVLNACHSAQAPLATLPVDAANDDAETLAVASFAEEVAQVGGLNVVAMSHQLSVSNAAHIVDDLYNGLASGATVPEAVRYARRRWVDGTLARGSDIGHVIIRVFLRRLPPPRLVAPPRYEPPRLMQSETPLTAGMDPALGASGPLFGTDDTILILDRVFDAPRPILLSGLAGSGKSETAREFARWLVASRRLAPDDIALIELGPASEAEATLERIRSNAHAFLIIENGERLHGNVFQDVPPWPEASVQAISGLLTERARQGRQALILTHTCPLGMDTVSHVHMRPLEIEDLRDFGEVVTGSSITDLLLLWTAGHPTSAELLFEYVNAGQTKTLDQVLEVLRQLRNGALDESAHALEYLRPLIFENPAIESQEIAPAWLLMQFQGRFVMPLAARGQDVNEIAHQLGQPHFAIFTSDTRPEALIEKLKRAGLVSEPLDGTLLLHPLLPCAIPHCYNCDPYRTKDAIYLLRSAKAFAAQYLMLVTGETSLFVPEMGRSHLMWPWHLHSVHNTWYSIAGNDLMAYPYVQKLGRKLRQMLEELPDLEARRQVVARMRTVFEDHPPDGPGRHELMTAWVDEQLSIALADGNKTAAKELARHLADMMATSPTAGTNDQTSHENKTVYLSFELTRGDSNDPPG